MTPEVRKDGRLFLRIGVTVAIILAGFMISDIVIQPTVAKAIAALVATSAAIALLPAAWLRVLAFICVMAAFFGMTVIARDYGHHVLYGNPLPRSSNDYLRLGTASAVFAGVWLFWWLWARRLAKHANSNT